MYWLTKSLQKIASLRRTLFTIAIGTFCGIGASLSIGLPAEARCLVFVRGNSVANLQQVRTIVPKAFVTQLPQISNQPVIQAGVFNQDANAPRLINALSSRGITGEKLCVAGTGNDDPDPMTTADSNTGDSANSQNDAMAEDNPDSIEIAPNQPSSQPQGLATAVSPPNSPVTTNSNIPQVASRSQQTVIPQTQLPVQFPTQSNCNCQADNSNNLGTNNIASNNTSGNLINSGTTASANHRYVTAVPTQGNPEFLLSRVKQFVPNAVVASSWRGSYIHAGAYPNRDAAESVSRYLRSQGIDSRVLFF